MKTDMAKEPLFREAVRIASRQNLQWAKLGMISRAEKP